ncbi:hypothetical protein EIP91_003662 [Steccherinum ochraceum]|uniref:VASt domain-containing protein n=1 Tax=Steccherinum ochraceum TaxID=92696 RepID=A0A4R0RA32_9APHY|nr:hypothetical protein EIP91_003662 [Steccherinum ochraceum]
MAPGFFSKLVKNNDRYDRARTPSLSATSSRNASISIPVPTIAHPVVTTATPQDKRSINSDTSSNPNVTVIPPSPIPSELSLSNQTQDAARAATDAPGGDSTKKNSVRRKHSLSLGSKPTSAPSPPSPSEEDDPSTPIPGRPNMAERSSTARPLSHASSTGDLKEAAKNASQSPSRSTTVVSPTNAKSNGTASESNLASSQLSPGPTLTTKSSRSKLAAKLGLETSTPSLPIPSRHERAATMPPEVSSPPVKVDPPSDNMSPIVESPTNMTHSHSLNDFHPKPSLSASATMPNGFPSSSLLGLPDKSDTASIHSVNSTTKKRRPWRRSSVKEATSPILSPASPITPGSGSKSPKRKATGLAGAIAMSSMAMVNPGMNMPLVSPNESQSSTASTAGRHTRSGSTTASVRTSTSNHRTRTSIDHPRTPPSRGNRSRRTSMSYANSEMSDRDSFHSGMSGSSDGSDSEGGLHDLDLDADDIPVTGFAVASNMRNQEFHKMFQGIPEGDYLIEDYGCALQREILIQGRLYISENHVCFHANIFGWITDLVIPMYDVLTLDKRMTAFVIPNAISLTTRNAKYTFTSFLSRDTTFDVLYNVWRLARPEDESLSSLGASQLSPSQASVTSGVTNGFPGVNGNGNGIAAAKTPGKKAPVNKVTQCACSKAGQHYSELASESILPGTPEKIYNLMFTSGFIKDFMRIDQKLLDIQISDWMPLPDNPALLTRNMSYIKPLSGAVGPRQTKCELRDELAHSDFDDYVTMLTTTRTPDAPSGGVFSVKTRTCITWASSITTKVLVTTQVEWTGRSFIKGIIEKSCIDGQKTYHAELDKAMREYIHKHQSEFIPEGIDVAEVEEAEVQSSSEAPKTPTQETALLSDEQARKAREKERNQRGLQWAWDTFEGAFNVAKRSTEGAFELVSDAWDQSSSTTVLYFVIAILVISNVWTLTMMGKREEVGRRKELKRAEEREKWVQGVVTGLWDELAASRAVIAAGGGPTQAPVVPLPQQPSATGVPAAWNWKEEVGELNNALDAIEARVKTLRESVKDLD